MPPTITGKMMLIDTSICMACRGCQVACKDWHQLPAETTAFAGTYENPLDLSGITYTRVRFNEVAGLTTLKYLEWLFFKDQCRHCVKPKCQMACPIPGAIVVEPSGAVVITNDCDPTICVTRPCEWKCPYDIPRLNEEVKKEKKCDFCFDRIADGKAPICAKTCPPGAITFGDASYVQGVANDRLAEVRAEYPAANIYPDGVMGGGGKGGGVMGGGKGAGTRVRWLLVDGTSAYGITSGGGGGMWP